jgi:hypothetical protein
MSESDAGKMRGLMGKGKLTTIQLVKQLSTGQSSKEIATPRQVGARNDSTDYPCPRSTLHSESCGRSWAMNNTSNLPGVEST